MPATDLWLLLAGCVACVMAAGAAELIVRRRFGQVDQWMPEALKNHTLAYVEQTFRSGGHRTVIARVDRAYRRRNGQIVLVEFKTRQADRVHPSDIIELSAQRVALEGETGETVAGIGWVVVEWGSRRTAHRVILMSPQAVSDLAWRRDALLWGTASPRYPATPGVCASCAYRRRCRLGADP